MEEVERALLDTSTILRRADEIAAQITADYASRDLTMVCVLNGAILFMADLLRRIPLPLKLDCLRVASYHGGTESTGVVKFDRDSMPELEGRHVLIVDDILDTGRTLRAIRERLLAESHPASVEICVLLSKRKARAKEVEAKYVGFEIGDEFVVGYGLDYEERFRNLPYVGVLKEKS